MYDLISVIVLIYRVEEYLDQCIQSIINQTYKNLEILLIDDGSDDGCGKICDKYAMIDNRIKVIHKKNEGIHEARKTGILAAKGKYVAYVDGDDWIKPNMYENLLSYMIRYNVDTVESGVIHTWSDEEIYKTPYFEEGCYIGETFLKKIAPQILYSGDFFRHGLFPYMWSKLFVREKLLKFQLIEDSSKNMTEDIIVSMPYIGECKSVYVTHECYYHYRIRLNSSKRLIRPEVDYTIINIGKSLLKQCKNFSKEYDIKNQIYYYIMYLMISKAPYFFDNNENLYLKPFGKIKKEDKIILYGAGQVGITLEAYIRSVSKDNLICWVDKKFMELDKSMNVEDPKIVKDKEFDYIIISILSEGYVKSAKEDLLKLGVEEEKIVWIKDEYLQNPRKLIGEIL